ncbi:MAG: hypothetical protein QW620_05625 [Thermoplasmata archaeon]
MLFLVGTQFISVILLLIGILSVLSNPDISIVLTTILNVMSSKNPFIFVPAVLLSLFSFLSYLFFFIGWFFLVYGENEIPSGFPESVSKGSIFAFFYLIVYLVRVSVSLFALVGFGTLMYIQEIFVGSGLLFNIIDAILLSTALLYFARANAYPTTAYHIRNTGFMYVGGAACAAIGYTTLICGIIFSAVIGLLVVAGLVLIYLGFGVMIASLIKLHELYFVIVKRIEEEDYIHKSTPQLS